MLLEDIGNYLLEISRVLKPNGRMLATCFLLDPPARERLKKMNSRFRHVHGDSLAIDPRPPEASIAHEEAAIRNLFKKAAWPFKIRSATAIGTDGKIFYLPRISSLPEK